MNINYYNEYETKLRNDNIVKNNDKIIWIFSTDHQLCNPTYQKHTIKYNNKWFEIYKYNNMLYYNYSEFMNNYIIKHNNIYNYNSHPIRNTLSYYICSLNSININKYFIIYDHKDISIDTINNINFNMVIELYKNPYNNITKNCQYESIKINDVIKECIYFHVKKYNIDKIFKNVEYKYIHCNDNKYYDPDYTYCNENWYLKVKNYRIKYNTFYSEDDFDFNNDYDKDYDIVYKNKLYRKLEL